jgi:hypothetical protein
LLRGARKRVRPQERERGGRKGTHVVRRLPHVRELVQQVRHLTDIRIRRQEADHPRSIPDQLAQRRPRIVRDRHARRGVDIARESRVVVRLSPDGRGDIVGVDGEDGDYLVGVGVEPCLDGSEVGGERSAVKEEAATGAKAECGG